MEQGTNNTTEQPQVNETPMYEIDGESYSAEQLKEFKNGYLRQDDYTRKTQALAEERKKLMAKPQEVPVQEQPQQTDKWGEPVTTEPQFGNDVEGRLAQMEYNMRLRDLEMQSNNLKAKYGDAYNEEAVVAEAHKRGIYDDLEFVYKATQASQPFDKEAYKQQVLKEYIEGGQVPQSIIGGTDAPQQVVNYETKLNSSEKEFCSKRGYSYEEYYNMKNAQYNL